MAYLSPGCYALSMDRQKLVPFLQALAAATLFGVSAPFAEE
jgi:hypothetical protein